MGRGPRSNQAISFRAMPRLMRRPKKVGQKRYNVDRVDEDGNHHREPGYIITIVTDLKLLGNEMMVTEEVAVKGRDGKLYWVKKKWPVYDSTGRDNPLRLARKMAIHLNKNPLGPVVTKEVDKEGNLEIGLGRRLIKTPDRGLNYSSSKSVKEMSSGGEGLTIINFEGGEPPKSFDITDPEQAKQAGDLFEKLTERKTAEEDAVIEEFVTFLANSEVKEDLELAEKLFDEPEQNSDKINTAKRFSEALDKGDTKTIEKELATKQKEKDAAGAKRSASRMKDTLRSLGGS
jgi:hypothetical protein